MFRTMKRWARHLLTIAIACACVCETGCKKREPPVVRQAISFYVAVQADDHEAPRSAGAEVIWLPVDDPNEWVNRRDDWKEIFVEAMAAGGLVARMTDNGEASILVYCDANRSMMPNVSEPWNVVSIWKISDSLGRPALGFTLDESGAALMRQLTSGNINRSLAIAVDGVVLTCPRLNSSIGRDAIIEGSFTHEEIDDFIAQLHEAQTN